MRKLMIVLLFSSLFTSCLFSTNGYKKISAKQAKSMIDEDDKLIILDVRREDEYLTGHIENAILLPDYEIKDKAEEVLKDKDAKILVYCRSGRRSKSAALLLLKLGYTNVYDFGGILSWPYEIVI